MSDEVAAEAEEYERHYAMSDAPHQVPEDSDFIGLHIAALETKIRHFEAERRLWQAVARAAGKMKQDGRGWYNLAAALDAARASGLIWEGNTTDDQR